MTIKMICAVGPKGEFGNEGGLPWDVPGDLQHFKKYTQGCTMVMSSSTFITLPGKLPGRRHVVIGREGSVAKNGSKPDLLLPKGTDLLTTCNSIEGDVVVIGGRDFLVEASTFVDAASITHISEESINQADTYIDVGTIEGNLLKASLCDGFTEFDNYYIQEWV